VARGVPVIALALALLLAPPASAQPSRHERALRDGTWNQRVHAATALGALGPEALPLLSFAARDADWQVRMTAVHEMGRVGSPALGALETVLRQEPCRHVRLTAVHWLGSLGPEASDVLHRALSDESGMVRLMGRYWLKKDEGKAAPPESWDAASASNEDLRACVRNPQPGRAPWAEGPDAAPAGDEPAPVDEAVATKDPVVERPAEPLAPAPAPESFPEPAKLDRASLKELDDVLYASTKRAGAPAPSVKRPKDPATPELLPPGGAGFGERPAPETAGADIAQDKGKGKMANDPLPVLLAYLKDSAPAKRARAADELGRRAAAEAVPALTAALKDRAPRVRASAALALGNIGAPSDAAVPAIVAALKRGPEEVAWSAALALGRIGTPRARRAFARSLR
jgi:HEAT repeat protein